MRGSKKGVVGRNNDECNVICVCGTVKKMVRCAFPRSHDQLAFRKPLQFCRDSQGTASWIRYTNPQKQIRCMKFCVFKYLKQHG